MYHYSNNKPLRKHPLNGGVRRYIPNDKKRRLNIINIALLH